MTGGVGFTGSTGGGCTDDLSGAGESAFGGTSVGGCLNNDVACGLWICRESVGMLSQLAYQADPGAQVAVCAANGGTFYAGVPCSELVENLVGGCELAYPNGLSEATDIWWLPGGCYNCGVCAAAQSFNPNGTDTCLAAPGPIPTDAGSCVPIIDTAAEMQAGYPDGGFPPGPPVSGTVTLHGGPIAGSPTIACTATGTVEGTGILLQFQNASTPTEGSDGGWGIDQAFLIQFGSTSITPGTYVGADGGTWAATFDTPDGSPVGVGGVGSMTIHITGSRYVPSSRDYNLSGTATAITPGWPQGQGDGGYITADFTFSD